MSDHEDIAIRIKRAICAQLEVRENDVTPEASLVDDLGADSLAMVELTLALEEEFEIEIQDDGEACEKVKTVGDLIAYVRARARA